MPAFQIQTLKTGHCVLALNNPLATSNCMCNFSEVLFGKSNVLQTFIILFYVVLILTPSVSVIVNN